MIKNYIIKINESVTRNNEWQIKNKKMNFKSNDIRVNDFVNAIKKNKRVRVRSVSRRNCTFAEYK